jgi:KDO2-lipid IV(A) lauroyltransferase
MVDYMLELAEEAASRAVTALPPQNRYLLADLVTKAVPLLAPRLFHRTRHNFARSLQLSHKAAEQLARQAIRNFGRMAVDFLWVRTLANCEIEAVTSFAGEANLWDSLRGNRGAIFVLPHMGCWDVAAARASAASLAITIVTEGTWAARFAAGARERPGISLVSRDRSLGALLRAHKSNEGVVLLSDLARPGVHTIDVPFFRHPAPLPSGPARLSARTGAPIIALACVRTSAARYRVEFRPPIWPEEATPDLLTARMAAEFEWLIREYPDQWYPFGRIWADQRLSMSNVAGSRSPRN